VHLNGLDSAADDETALALVCGSVDRVLRAGLQRLDRSRQR
jgi:hypothetical protein